MYDNNMYYQQPPTWGQQTVHEDKRTYCQTLTQEEIDSLRKRTEEFTLGITKRDNIIAICMHRYLNGEKAYDKDPVTNKVKCFICGESFNLVDDLNIESVDNAVNNLLDVLQTTKLLYLDMPSDAAKMFYPIIAMIKKIPGLWKISTENFAKHENANYGYTFNGYGDMMNVFNSMAFGAGSINPNMYYYNNGMMPQQQPYYNPNYNPNVMGAPMQQGQNPFGYNGQPVVAQNYPQNNNVYSPQVQGYSYVPNNNIQQPQQQPVNTNINNSQPQQANNANNNTGTNNSTNIPVTFQA